MEAKKRALEEEKRRREQLEKRLQEETSQRQKLIEKEVKIREKQRSQVSNLLLILYYSIYEHLHALYIILTRDFWGGAMAQWQSSRARINP